MNYLDKLRDCQCNIQAVARSGYNPIIDRSRCCEVESRLAIERQFAPYEKKYYGELVRYGKY